MKAETPCRFARSVRRAMVVIICLASLIVPATVTRASVETLRIEQSGRVPSIHSDAPMIIEIAPGIKEVILDGVSTPGLEIAGGSADTIIKLGGDLVIGGPLVIDVDGRVEVDTRSAGRGLRLIALDSLRLEASTVHLADSIDAPLELRSGGNLVVVARELLDVDALDDPATRIVSSGNLVLRSDNPVRGDAHWRAGRDLRIETLDGRPGDLISPKDPVVLSTRNVSLGAYTGASLHILAGGSVTAADVTINGSDTAANTIGPGNTATFNGTDTFADLASVVLSDGTPVAVDGAARPTLDIRAGIDWSTFSGGPPVPDDRVLGAVGPTFGSPVTSADISLGFVRVNPSAGLVLLTNRYHPKAALVGLVSTNGINTITGVPNVDAGSVIVDSKGDALLGSIKTEAFILVEGVATVGSAGDVMVLAADDLDVSMVNANSWGPVGFAAGNGGSVTLKAGGRLLSTPNISTFANSNLGSGDGGDLYVDVRGPVTFGRIDTGARVDGAGDAGSAGNVTIIVRSDGSPDGGETLNVTEILTDAGSVFDPGVVGISGNGGWVELRTEDGDIEIVERIWTATWAGGGANPSGDGGDVVVEAVNGDIAIGALYGDLGINTRTVADDGSTGATGKGGDVSLVADGNIVITPAAGIGGIITSTTSDNGQAGLCGSVSISAAGDIDLGVAGIQTDADGRSGITGPGGPVDLGAGGPITTAFVDTSSIGRDGGSAADGGAVAIVGGGAVSAGSLDSRSVAFGPGGEAGNGGPVTVTTSVGTIATGPVRTGPYAAAGGGNAGSGGAITITAPGDLSVTPGMAYSSNSNSIDGTSGAGGNVSVITAGSLAGLDHVLSYSSGSDGSGAGGSVTLDAIGPLSLGSIISSSWVQVSGAAGDAGAVQLISRGPSGGIALTNVNSESGCWQYGGAICSAGSSGLVALTTESGDVVVSQDISAHAIARGAGNSADGGGLVTVSAPLGLISIGSGGIATRTECINGGIGSAGPAGGITLSALGDITIATAGIIATAQAVDGPAVAGGPVTLASAAGSIDLNGAAILSSTSALAGPSGPAGAIQLTAAGTADIGNLLANSYSETAGAGNGGNVTLNFGGSLLAAPGVWTHTKGANGAGDAGDVVIDVPGPAFFGSIRTYSRSSGAGDTMTGGDVQITVRNTGAVDGADDLLIGNVLADAGTWTIGSGVGSGGDAGDVNIITEDGDIETTGPIWAFSGARGTTVDCGQGGTVAVTAVNGGISIGTGGINATAVIGNGSTGTAGRGGSIRLIADGDVVLPSTTNGTGLWTTCTADDGVALGAGEIEVRSQGGAVDLGAKFFWARSQSERGTAGPGGNVIVNAATTITGGDVDVSSFSDTGTGGPAGYVDVRAAGDVELSRIRGTSEGAGGGSEGGLFVVDTTGLLRLTGGAVDQPTVDATGISGTGWVVLSHGGGAANPFTVGDASTNGSAWDIVTIQASLAPTTAYPQTHHEAPSVWLLGDEPALLVNEFDVDQPGTDEGEFIELYNPLPEAQFLDLTYFDIVDGTAGWANVIYEPAIRGLSIPANGYVVLCPTGSTLSTCDYYDDFNLPDVGPAAVSIRLTGIIEDVVSYEGDTPDGFTEGTGVGLEDPGTSDYRSLSRIPDGADTNHNANDFSLRCVSPGLPNLDITAGCTFSGGPELGAISTTPGVIDEGSSVLVAGTFSEPPPAVAHTVSIEWGDGTTTDIPLGAGTTVYDASHLFADDAFGLDAPLDIKVSVTDGVSTDEQWASITIVNVAPTVVAGPDQIVMVGELVAFSGGFSDPGSLDTHSLYWTFGDGGSDNTSLTPTHTYAGAGTYTVTLQIEDDDGGIGSDSLFVEVEAAAPRVVRLDTVARAGAGGLSPGEGLAQPVTVFEVGFSNNMLNPAGSSSPVDVTNPSNYRVITAGGDGVINTFTCDPPSGDDEIVVLAGVAWDGPTRTAAARVASEKSLERGGYRLILCADGLTNTDGAELDGNGDGTGGDDLLLDFYAMRTDLLSNPNFDLTVSGWTDVAPAGSNFSHVAVDGEGSAWSGSAQATNTSGAGAHLELNRCVELPPEAVEGITLRALVRMDPIAVDDSRASAELRFFAGPGCTGALLENRQASPVLADTAGSFIPVASPGRPPGGAVSVEAALLADADSGETSVFTVAFDRVSVAADGAIFEDGFEMGDSVEWDSTTP